MSERCRAVLESSWLEREGFCPPNPVVYPHQWLWDSCFHAIAWAALGDARGMRELASCFKGQLAGGFVPHMRYLAPSTSRGPLHDRSSYTQPPIYAHALRVLSQEFDPAPLMEPVRRALEWLWESRRTDDGLLFIVHPWESGTDDSPRWDSWVGVKPYDRELFRAHDVHLVEQTFFDHVGAAVWSREFVVAPASFNAFAAHAAGELALLTGDLLWRDRAVELARCCDELLWDEQEGLWADRPVVGGGVSARIPSLEGALGALVTDDAARAERALSQLGDRERFAAPYGLAYVPRGHESYDPDAYWRGPAWPQLNYMVALAASRWERADLFGSIADCTMRGAEASGFAEYWNPETGAGLGAVPQGWAALAATFAER